MSSSPEHSPAFIKTAEAFCAHIERAAECDHISFVRVSFRLICALLSEVTELPEVDGNIDTHRISGERRHDIAKLVKDRIGEDDCYRMMVDPYEGEAEPLFGLISDDLAGIWQDVKDGLETLRNGSLNDAIADWRFSFAFHWGPHHARHVLSPLLSILFKNGWYES